MLATLNDPTSLEQHSTLQLNEKHGTLTGEIEFPDDALPE